MKKDNPASRLYLLIKESESVVRTQGQVQRTVWRGVLNMSDASDGKLNMQIGKVMGLPEEIMNWLSENFPSKKWVVWKKAFDNAFANIHLNGMWVDISSKIDDRAMTELDFIATLYETKGSVELIDTKTVDEFKKELLDLKVEVIASENLTEGMKKQFIHYINKIIDAIESYQITGVEPIMEAIESAFGHVVVDKDYGVAIKDSGIGDKLLRCMIDIADAVATSQGLPAVGAPMLELLTKK